MASLIQPSLSTPMIDAMQASRALPIGWTGHVLHSAYGYAACDDTTTHVAELHYEFPYTSCATIPLRSNGLAACWSTLESMSALLTFQSIPISTMFVKTSFTPLCLLQVFSSGNWELFSDHDSCIPSPTRLLPSPALSCADDVTII